MAQNGPESSQSRQIATRVNSNELGLWTPDAQRVIDRVNIHEAVTPSQGIPVEEFDSETPKVVNFKMDNSTSMRSPGQAKAIIEGHNRLINALRTGYNPSGVLFGSSFMNPPRPTESNAYFIHGTDAVRYVEDVTPVIHAYSPRLHETDRYSQFINSFGPISEDSRPITPLTEANLYLQGFTPFYRSGVEALTATGVKLDELKADYRPGIGFTLLFTDGLPERDSMTREDLKTLVTSLMPIEGDDRIARNLVIGYGAGENERAFTDLFLGVGIPRHLILTSRATEQEFQRIFGMVANMAAQANEANIQGLIKYGFG